MSIKEHHSVVYNFGFFYLKLFLFCTAHINKNACAFNMLGLILERRQLYQGAAEAFEAALHTLEKSKDCALLDIVHSNYARVLVQLQHYEQAIQQYQQVKKADFVTQCGLALAYFKGKWVNLIFLILIIFYLDFLLEYFSFLSSFNCPKIPSNL